MKRELRWYRALGFCRILGSLNKSVIKAGGHFFTVNKLKNITAFELLQTLGTNNIVRANSGL
ncbi:unnamed protein product, partial [marine sediment metagenome]